MTNVLLITLDQFRGDCLSSAGHRVVRTPGLDRLAANGVSFRRHYSQAAPCAPGRAALYTGTYQSNNRVVANGTPLDRRFDNVALAARRSGYRPVLFGYTDQGVDPRDVTEPDDPRLSTYEGVLPGFDVALDLSHDAAPWIRWLADLGHDVAGGVFDLLGNEASRPASHGLSSFTTDRVIEWLGEQHEPWFAHVSYLRPHPPFSAAGEWSTTFDPDECGGAIDPVAAEDRHPFHSRMMVHPFFAAPQTDDALRQLRSQYFGMIADVDAQMDRLWTALIEQGAWDDTLVIVTSDHGEQLGDHGLLGKGGFFESSYHVINLVRDPAHPERHGTAVSAFTENVDIFPTICDAIGAAVPSQCDGLPLTPFLRGVEPPWWRSAAHWEFDWRASFITESPSEWPWDRRLERQHLAVIRFDDAAYVQFGDGSWLAFDLAADPTWRTELVDPAKVLPLAQAMLTWRSTHADRTLTDMLLERGGIGRRPTRPGTATVPQAR